MEGEGLDEMELLAPAREEGHDAFAGFTRVLPRRGDEELVGAVAVDIRRSQHFTPARTFLVPVEHGEGREGRERAAGQVG